MKHNLRIFALLLALALLLCACRKQEVPSDPLPYEQKQEPAAEPVTEKEEETAKAEPQAEEPPEQQEKESEPEPEKTPEPEKEPEPEKDPEPEKEPEPEKDPEPEKEPEPEQEPVPEETQNDGAPSGSQGVPVGDIVPITYVPEVVTPGATYTGRAPLDPIEYSLYDPGNIRGLSTEKHSFSFGAAKDGTPHQITVTNQDYFDSLGTSALAWDNVTEEKVLYLTFDCGYEYGTLTSDMLDILLEKEVPAAFFCTLSYLKTAPEVVTRMIAEGHIVGNHSATHPSDCAALNRDEMAEEVLGVDNYLRVNFGYESEYFRFPSGVYSENAQEVVDSVGYKSVFWSIAHTDWDPENQPGVEKSFQTVTERLHPGAVILLHSTSPDNAAILGDFIDYAREQGYTFRTLDEYPW